MRIRNNARKNNKLKIINSVKNIIGVFRLIKGILQLGSINNNSREIAKEIQICETIWYCLPHNLSMFRSLKANPSVNTWKQLQGG